MQRRLIGRLLAIIIAIAAVFLVVLLVLIGAGILVLPANGPTPVTITSVTLKIQQGNTSSGVPWFGPSTVVYNSSEGYPIHVQPGQQWTVVWTFANFDDHFHNITAVMPTAPITLGSTRPALPFETPPNQEDLALSMSLVAPSNAGASYSVTVQVIATTIP